MTGGRARRTGEADLDNVSDDPVVGATLAKEGDQGETAWPPSNSGALSLSTSNKMLRSNDSIIGYKSCCLCHLCLVHGGEETGGSHDCGASPQETLAAGCGWDTGGLCASCIRVFLP